jgi:DNA-binding beta-propeller fold protein YncE
MEVSMRHGGLVGLLAVGALLTGTASAQEYKLEKTVKVGGEGGWDYLTVDAAARRLYVSRSSHVMVLDADTLQAVGDIPDTSGVHGIAIAAELGKGFTSNGRAHTLTVFDTKTLEATGEVKAGTNPDAILYDAFTQRVFAFNGGSGDVTVVDAKTGTVAGRIPIGGKLEFGQSDGKGQVFVNVEDKGEIVALDARQMKVLAHWPIAPCEEPTGLAFDAAHRRLFSVCGNRMMAVVDADTGKLVTTLPIGAGSDGAVFDATSQNAFSSNGEGTLTVVHESAPDRFEVVQTVKTQRGARTIALDPKTRRLLLPAAEFGPPPPATPQQPRQRPPLVPGSFALVVVSR